MSLRIYKKQIVQNQLLKRESEGRGCGGQSATDVVWILMILKCTVNSVMDQMFTAN